LGEGAAEARAFDDEQIAAHHWLTEAFEPIVAAIPAALAAKLEPAQVFHEVLDHRWYLSEAAGGDVGLEAALRSYVETVLAHKPDERALIDPPAGPASPDPFLRRPSGFASAAPPSSEPALPSAEAAPPSSEPALPSAEAAPPSSEPAPLSSEPAPPAEGVAPGRRDD
ncbi:MAG TPA: DUF4032 domain-containing protein, partial [Polyangiaceae bacterium]|nr:DUF4032 domain-containing protein [Polyangiaceae bacterium]